MSRKKWFHLHFLILLVVFCTSSISSDNLKEAKKAYSGRQFQKAVKLFQEYSKANPSDGEPYMYLGYIYESLREYNISIAYFRKAVELKLTPKQKPTVLLKLIIYFNYLKAWNYVVHYCNQYLAVEPGNQEVEKILARARGNRGNDHVTSVTLSPQEKEREKDKDKDKEKEPKKNEKQKDSEKSTKEPENKIVHLKVKKEFPSEENAILHEVNNLIENGEYGKAEGKIVKLLEISPKNKNYLLKAGIIHVKLKDYNKAINVLEQITKNIPENDDSFNYILYLNYGLALANLDRFEVALENLKKSYSYGKSFSPILLIIRMKYENGDFEDALRYSNYISSLDNENLEAIMYRALSKLQLGIRIEGFRELLYFSKKLKLTHNNFNEIPEKYSLGLHYLGVYYSGRKKYKLSNKYLNLAQKIRLPSYIFARGKNLYYLKNYSSAQIEFEKLSEIPAANYLLSKIFINNNSPEKVKDYFVKAAKKRDLYWSRAITDPTYKPFLQGNQEFYNFIITKGNPIKTPGAEDIKIN